MKIPSQRLLFRAACLLATCLLISSRLAADDTKPADAKPVAADKSAADSSKPASSDSAKPASSDSAKPTTKPAKSTGPTSVASAAGGPASDPDALKLHLMDGSVITGRLSLKELQVETKFGMLNVPVANVRSFTPGLSSHPALAKQIAGWIEDLGSGTFNDREAAQQALMKLGPAIRAELERRHDDSDAERRTRVRAILSEFEQAQDDADELGDKSTGTPAYIQDDTIATSEFTIVGRIVPQSFAVNSLYGPLTIKLTDIRTVDRDSQKKEELPTNFTVTGAHIVFNGTLNTGIRLEKGDSVTISASGSLVMTPWGNQTVGPDGSTNFGLFNNNRQIPVGALVGKVGTGEDYFKVGTHHSFTADKTGVLHLGIAMRPEQAGNEFPGKYAVKIRVVRKQ